MDKDLKIGLAEVSYILNHMDKSDKDKISKEFLEFIEENKDKDYVPSLDYPKELNDMELSKEAKNLLAIIYMKYWCNPQQKKEFIHKLKENEKKYQELLRKKYNPDDVLKNRKKK